MVKHQARLKKTIDRILFRNDSTVRGGGIFEMRCFSWEVAYEIERIPSAKNANFFLLCIVESLRLRNEK